MNRIDREEQLARDAEYMRDAAVSRANLRNTIDQLRTENSTLERQASRWQAVAKKLAETSRAVGLARFALTRLDGIYRLDMDDATKRAAYEESAAKHATAAVDHARALAEYDSLTGAGAENAQAEERL